MKASCATLRIDDPHHKTVVALSRFASRHAAAIYARHRRRVGLRQTIAELRDYCLAEGRLPARDTDPIALLEECRAWHEEIARLGGRELRVTLDESVLLDDGDLALPDPPCEDVVAGGVEVRAIRTLRALVEEGRAMHNCVASYLGEILARRSYVFSARVRGERLTVEAQPSRRRPFVLAQVAGEANREPSRAARAAIEEGFATLAARPAV